MVKRSTVSEDNLPTDQLATLRGDWHVIPNLFRAEAVWNEPSVDLKPIVSCDRQLNGLHVPDPGARRALLAPGTELSDRVGGSFDLNFHTSITTVAHPAPQTEVEGASAAAAAKTHALDPALNDQLPAFGIGLQSRGLAFDEASVQEAGTVASAARHRERS